MIGGIVCSEDVRDCFSSVGQSFRDDGEVQKFECSGALVRILRKREGDEGISDIRIG